MTRAPVPTLEACFSSMRRSPPPNRIRIGFNRKRNAARESAPSTPRPASFTAVFPRRQIAIAITANTAGLIPARTDAACGSDPKRTYAHANAPVMSVARHAEPGPARANESYIDGHLGGRGPRDKIRRSQHVQELLACYPLSLADNLSLEERNVRCRSAKTDGPQLQEEGGQFAQSAELG
jgi:hypothetical protein